MKKRIYVGCSLTHASQEFRDSIENFKNELRSSATVLDFVGLTGGSAQEVFEWDTNCVKSCDIFIADCSYPSIGLGYELGVAIENGKKVIAIAQEEALVGGLVLGVTAPQFEFTRYKNIQDVLPRVKELL